MAPVPFGGQPKEDWLTYKRLLRSPNPQTKPSPAHCQHIVNDDPFASKHLARYPDLFRTGIHPQTSNEQDAPINGESLGLLAVSFWCW